MIQKRIAALLVMLTAGFAPAAMAGDLVNPKLIPTRMTYARMSGGLAFVPPLPGQQPASTGASTKEWTKAGKILTIVGLAAVGSGAVMVAQKRDTYVGSGVSVNWRTTGAVWMGVGGALTAVGLTRRN